MAVYADVLVILNLYINYFLVRAAALLLRRDVSRRRSVIAASIGAAASLVMLLPSLPFPAVAAIKLAVCAGMTLAAFGWHGRGALALEALCMALMSFLFAGASLALWTFCAPSGMVYENGTAYFNVSLPALAAFTAAAYAAVRVVRFFDKKRRRARRTCEVAVTLGGKSAKLHGFADTGNGLRDPFSGRAVVICRRDALGELLPAQVAAYLNGSPDGALRLVPCRTVTGVKPLPVFRADSVTIDGKAVEAVIGVSDELDGSQCIFDPEIISM